MAATKVDEFYFLSTKTLPLCSLVIEKALLRLVWCRGAVTNDNVVAMTASNLRAS